MPSAEPVIVSPIVLPEKSAFLPSLLGRLQTSLNYELDAKLPCHEVTDAVEAAFTAYGIEFENSRFYRACIQVGVAVGDKMYPHHPVAVKVYTAIYSALAAIIDDQTNTMREDVEEFHQRFFANLPQKNPFLALFAATLHQTQEHYDPIIARFILLSSLHYINISLLETRTEYRGMPAKQGGERWAYYFRDKEGICEAYAYFCFPKATCPDISVFLQAIPEMCIPINYINDLFSFYKEEAAGEDTNYIHQRAKYHQKTVADVMQEMTDETIACHERVLLILQGHDGYLDAWLGYVAGFITFHKSCSRYRLKEIGQGC
ncbi:isoprenoid synthase domain-containing protein [Pterulicium gracile]|uniref:Isoprenoid synthase domain-containing protein n=1 Tax=Pterulicium gracile TaxID=1884261 RepID=A0A5C3Q6H1_9AGAR|nr:isoprenoid synthase domain-containing protein [Pterula gracilis]